MKKLWRHLNIFVFFVCTASAQPATLKKNDPLTWPQADAAAFGCFLEQQFKVVDKRFNCKLKNYKNSGDPCGGKDYFEGPQFPTAKARRVHPLIESISLNWEAGGLQQVQITFRKNVSAGKIQKIFSLPPKADSERIRPNVIDFDVVECLEGRQCLKLQGHTHMGAGDVECG